MGKRFVPRVAAALAVAFISGCGGEEDASTGNEDPADREQVYMEVIKDRWPNLDEEGEEAFWQFGRATCERYDDGGEWIETIALLVHETGLSGDEAGYVNGAVVGALCPEHQSKTPDG